MIRARKLTAATERRAAKNFRAFVMSLPPGSRVEWDDMDFWVFVNFTDFDDDAQGGEIKEGGQMQKNAAPAGGGQMQKSAAPVGGNQGGGGQGGGQGGGGEKR